MSSSALPPGTSYLAQLLGRSVLPVWPSAQSMLTLRDDFAMFVNANIALGLTNVNRPFSHIPVWSFEWRHIPLFFKEDALHGRQGTAEYEATVYPTINTLREFLPNFMFGLCITRCSPIWTQNGVGELNTTRGCIITEYENHPILDDLLKDSETLFLVNVWVQTMLAMQVAQNKIGMVHGDLNSKNVVIKRLASLQCINYDGIEIETDVIPIIFDFDRTTLNNQDNPMWDVLFFVLTAFKYHAYAMDIILSFYGLNLNLFPNSRSHVMEKRTWYPRRALRDWMANHVMNLHERSPNDIMEFAFNVFGYLPKLSDTCHMVQPENIPEYIPQAGQIFNPELPLIKPGSRPQTVRPVQAVRPRPPPGFTLVRPRPPVQPEINLVPIAVRPRPRPPVQPEINLASLTVRPRPASYTPVFAPVYQPVNDEPIPLFTPLSYIPMPVYTYHVPQPGVMTFQYIPFPRHL